MLCVNLTEKVLPEKLMVILLIKNFRLFMKWNCHYHFLKNTSLGVTLTPINRTAVIHVAVNPTFKTMIFSERLLVSCVRRNLCCFTIFQTKRLF
jgi:hypothetical protein